MAYEWNVKPEMGVADVTPCVLAGPHQLGRT